MNINTKYEIGQVLWFMFKNKPIKGIVLQINIVIYPWSSPEMRLANIEYWFAIKSSSINTNLDENDVFASEEELLKSL